MKITSLDQLEKVKKYLTRVGAEARSLKTAVIREDYGNYWKDVCVIKFSKDGDIDCQNPEYAPTEIEKHEIKSEIQTVNFPIIKPLQSIVNPPPMIANANSKDIFEFRNSAGEIIMIQVRVNRKTGKAYVPWTYWSDDVWRNCEPDGKLPLYNIDKLKDASVVFIHEGAKAARYCQEMVEKKTRETEEAFNSHPWGRELSNAAHIGWIGGAMNPLRTDWAIINKMGIKRAYIVADNDAPGLAAIPAISEKLRIPTFMIQFTDEFPASFDLADSFPESFFGNSGGIRHYIGPSFRDCLHPATWATDMISNLKGKPTPVLRDAFKEMWAYVEEADFFVCTEMPEILRPEEILNKMLAPFSHVAQTSRLIVKAYRGRSARVCYRPDHDGLRVTFRGSSAINLHIPTNIKSIQGDYKPWLDFLEYMFINDSEREEVKRWCATLIARPEVKIGYGLLLVSEKQGIGKTTLGANILAPLVGFQNVGFPSENDIVNSGFNGWMANKRLIIVNEIYSGASWKAYHSLKSTITDKDITVNQKYMRQYVIDNWCHVIACSNSMRALKMENDDRRWFYPEITETAWDRDKFLSFRKWIDGGGLSIIHHWALNFKNYIHPSERAPMTERKREMIEGSRSEAQREVAALAECLKDRQEPCGIFIKDIVNWVRDSVQGRVFDTDYELKKTMLEVGAKVLSKRLKQSGRMQYVIANDALFKAVDQIENGELAEYVRSKTIRPADLMLSPI